MEFRLMYYDCNSVVAAATFSEATGQGRTRASAFIFHFTKLFREKVISKIKIQISPLR